MSPQALLTFAIGLARFAVTAVLAVLVVFITYKVFIKANTDFDEEEAIRQGNVSVGLLVAALIMASANIIHQAMVPLLSLVSAHVTASGARPLEMGKLALHALGHLALGFGLAVAAISFALRLFGKLTRNVQEGVELHKGNVAVGLVLSAVVFVVALYIGEGVNALSRAILPEPGVARLKVMR